MIEKTEENEVEISEVRNVNMDTAGKQTKQERERTDKILIEKWAMEKK